MYTQSPVNPVAPPNTQFYVNAGLPYQPPVIPNVVLSPNFQQMLAMVTGYAMMAIQQSMQNNQLRAYYFNLVSRNGWMNEDFEILVGGTGQLAEFFAVTRRQPPETAIQQAAGEMVGMMAAIHGLRQQQFLGQFLNHNIVMDAQAKQHQFQIYAQQIARHFNAPRSYQQPAGQQFSGQANLNQLWGQQPPQGVPGNVGGLWGDNQATVPLHGGGGGFGGGLGTRKSEAISLTAEGPVNEPIQGTRVDYNPFDRMGGKQAHPMSSPHVSLSALTEWPKVSDLERPWDSILMENGIELRPAYRSGWEFKPSEMQPYRKIHNPTTHLLMHVRTPAGDIYESLHPRTPDMDYMKHELDDRLKGQTRESQRAADPARVAPNWGLAAHLRSRDTGPDTALSAENEMKDDANPATTENTPAPRVLDEVFQAHSLQEAEIKVALSGEGDENLRNLTAPFEFYYDQVVPVAVDKDELNTVRQLATCRNYPMLWSNLLEAQERLPENVWQMINQRLSAEITEVLSKNMSTPGWKTTSFAEDYTELLVKLKEMYGEHFVSVFNEHAPEVIGSTLSALAGDSFKRYVESIYQSRVQAFDIDEFREKLLVFRNRISVTCVPWKFDDLELDFNGGGMVPESEMPELHAALTAMFERTPDSPVVYSARYLMTADRKKIEIRRGYLDASKTCILLFPEQ